MQYKQYIVTAVQTKHVNAVASVLVDAAPLAAITAAHSLRSDLHLPGGESGE